MWFKSQKLASPTIRSNNEPSDAAARHHKCGSPHLKMMTRFLRRVPLALLVAEHVLVVGVDAGKRLYDARAQSLGDAARTLGQLVADDVGLLEVRMIRVPHDRLAIELVPEDVGEPRVPALLLASRVVDFERFGWVEVQIEVIRLQDAPVEFFVLDLIAAEVLCARRHAAKRHERQGERPLHNASDHWSPESTTNRWYSVR